MTKLTLEECENKPLFQWCIDRMGIHLDDKMNDYNDGKVYSQDEKIEHCRPLCDSDKRLELLEFINSEIQNTSDDELVKLIDQNRRTILNLKKFIEEKNDLANVRDYEQMLKVEKKTIQDLIFMIILLVIAICFGIFCIYHYFVFDFKKELIGK